MRVRNLVVAICVFAAEAANSATTPPSLTETILATPVNVSATCRTIDDTAFNCQVTTRLGTDVIATETNLIGMENGIREALAAIRATTAWRQGYLFIRSECGGGTSWSCATERVLTIRHGRLVVVGEFIVGDRRRPAQSLVKLGFRDYYDKLEAVQLPLSHADRPLFPLLIEERAGSLSVNLAATWALNEPTYREMLRRLGSPRKVIPQRQNSCEAVQSELLPQFAQALAITLYCHRTRESSVVLKRAEATLAAASLRALLRLTEIVKPSELPAAWRGKAGL